MKPKLQRIKELLQKNLHFYLSLKSGKRKPITDAQQHFVLMCQGEAKPNTEHEWAFLAYMQYLKRDELKKLERQNRKRFKEKAVSKSTPAIQSEDEWFGSPFWDPEKIQSIDLKNWDLLPGGSLDDQDDFADDHPSFEDRGKPNEDA